jgi:hypothetical protein
MREAIPPLPNTPSWRGAQLKNVQGQPYLKIIFRHHTLSMSSLQRTVCNISHIPSGVDVQDSQYKAVSLIFTVHPVIKIKALETSSREHNGYP